MISQRRTIVLNYSQHFRRLSTLIFLFILVFSLFTDVFDANVVLASSSGSEQAQTVSPFLYPPYPGAVAENSIFDHNRPTYTIQDRTIVSYSGHSAIGTQGDPAVMVYLIHLITMIVRESTIVHLLILSYHMTGILGLTLTLNIFRFLRQRIATK